MPSKSIFGVAPRWSLVWAGFFIGGGLPAMLCFLFLPRSWTTSGGFFTPGFFFFGTFLVAFGGTLAAAMLAPRAQLFIAISCALFYTIVSCIVWWRAVEDYPRTPSFCRAAPVSYAIGGLLATAIVCMIRRKKACKAASGNIVEARRSVHWTEPPNVSNLPQLMGKYQTLDGAIVEYQHVTSFILLSRRTFHYEWVSPGSSRFLLGVKHSVFCCLFGWWSVDGLLVWTPAAIISNLLGGVDITKALVSQGSPDMSGAQDEAAREIMSTRKKHMWAFIVLLAVLTTIVAIKCLGLHWDL